MGFADLHLIGPGRMTSNVTEPPAWLFEDCAGGVNSGPGLSGRDVFRPWLVAEHEDQMLVAEIGRRSRHHRSGSRPADTGKVPAGGGNETFVDLCKLCQTVVGALQ